MPVKFDKETDERIKKMAKWIGISYVETCKILIIIGLSRLEEKQRLNEQLHPYPLCCE